MNFRLFQTKEFADNNFKFVEKYRQFSKRIENTVRKGKNCSVQAIFPFPTVFQKSCTADTCLKKELIDWCFTPLPTLFQSYHGDNSHYSYLHLVSPVLGWDVPPGWLSGERV